MSAKEATKFKLEVSSSSGCLASSPLFSALLCIQCHPQAMHIPGHLLHLWLPSIITTVFSIIVYTEPSSMSISNLWSAAVYPTSCSGVIFLVFLFLTLALICFLFLNFSSLNLVASLADIPPLSLSCISTAEICCCSSTGCGSRLFYTG